MNAFVRVFALLFIFCLTYAKAFTQDKYVVGHGKANFQWESDAYYSVTLYSDDELIDFFQTQEYGGEFRFGFALNHVCLLVIEKPGYISQKIVFNTFVPRSITSAKDFTPFKDFEIITTLVKLDPNDDAIITTDAIGLIRYNPEIENFDWDTAYRFEIKRNMDRIQARLMTKYEQELKLRKAQEQLTEQEILAIKQTKVEADKQAQIELERKEKEEKRLAELEAERKKQEEEERVRLEAVAAKQAKLEAEKQAQLELEQKEKEEKRLAELETERIKQEEEERIRIEALAAKQAKVEAEEEKRLADLEKAKKLQEEEERVRLEAVAAKQAKLEAEKQVQIELERKEEEAKEKAEEEKRLAELEKERKLQEEERARQKAINAKKAKLEAERQVQLEIEKKIAAQQALEAKKQADEEAAVLQKEKDEYLRKKEQQRIAGLLEKQRIRDEKKAAQEKTLINTKSSNSTPIKTGEFEVAGKITTKTKVTNNNHSLIYVKVKHKWGGTFYFIEEEPGHFVNISAQLYNLKVKNKENDK